MRFLKRAAWIVLAGTLMSFPASVYLSLKNAAPFWYVTLFSIVQALGLGLFAIFFGVIVLIAGRKKEDGGMKTALILMAVVTVVTSFAVISAQGRM